MSKQAALFSPVPKALLSKNPATMAENYDEFQDDNEITEIIKANPVSILRVDMAHANPGSLYDDPYLPEALDFAKEQLGILRSQHLFSEIENFFFVYRIQVVAGKATNPNPDQIGLGGMANTSLIADPVTNPNGRIIRNEAIFAHKAEGRSKLIDKLKAVIGIVNLITPDPDKKLEKHLRQLIANRKPDIASTDRKGDIHEVYVIKTENETQILQGMYADLTAYVADGNHRSKGAQMIGLSSFLSVIFCGGTMNIDPYHRLISAPSLKLNKEAFLKKLSDQHFKVTPLASKEPYFSKATHQMGLYFGGTWHVLEPQKLEGLDPKSSIDAQIIEDRLIKAVLAFDPGDERIAYVGGDYNPSYLQKVVDEGKYDLALSMPAMTMKEFYAINEARLMLPRKTTWFTPKIRSGLVIALI